jgi:hypothetical protein
MVEQGEADGRGRIRLGKPQTLLAFDQPLLTLVDALTHSGTVGAQEAAGAAQSLQPLAQLQWSRNRR